MFHLKFSYKNKKAFSLLELSIVIVIIGVLLIGIIGSKHIITKSRLTTAMAMTRSSPINGTPNNKLWLESSLSDISLGENLSTGDAITSWGDNSINNTSLTISAVGTGATYSNTINHIQAVKFDSTSSSNHLQIDDASFLNGTDYTIFITEKRIGTNSGDGNYLLGSDGSFAVGYESGTTIIQTHGETADDDNQATIEALSSYSNKPRTITFTHSSTDGNKIYINGTLANEDSTATAKAHLSEITTLAIGNNYNGEIGEIVIFNRDLKTVERREIEDYMTDKWASPNNRDSSASCTSGTVISTGCDSSCSISINGSSDTNLASGSSTNFTCDGTGYVSGSTTLEYTCNDGTLSPSTPATSQCVDDLGCDSGYLESSGACVQGCIVSTISGASYSGTTVADSTIVTCDETGYDDSTIATCSDGNSISGTCGCDTDNNYTDSNSDNICEAPCTISSSTIGVDSDVTVLSGSSSYDCSNSGSYTGTITYSCNNNSISSISGTCSLDTICTGGDSTNTSAVPGDVIHIFTTIGTTSLYCSQSITAKVLVVAGGGSGGGVQHGWSGGGGGGGGLIYDSNYSISAEETISVTVGNGGTGSGDSGDNSIFGSLTAIGGGTSGPYSNGTLGGSGGGGGNTSGKVGGSGTLEQGNAGGNGYNSGTGSSSYGGGGGGAGTAGGNADADNGGDGGDGLAYDITGTSVYYAGGGGGHCHPASYSTYGYGTPGSGGLGGGGDAYVAGTANTGGGGGSSANGGSGIIIVRYTNP